MSMSPRAYQAGKRRELATEATRARIIAAARELLADPRVPTFSIDAVAERADVARMTVYYQFKSKGKLLEALFDDFGARANMRDLRKAFQDTEPARAVNTLIEIFSRLWESQRPLVRRLNAMAVLDPEVDSAVTERGGWRREALSELVRRFPLERTGADEVVELLHVLTSFESYDALAKTHRTRGDVARLLQRAAAGILATPAPSTHDRRVKASTGTRDRSR